MDVGDFIDTDIFYNPAYWILVIVFEAAVMIGFGGGGILASWGLSAEAETMIPIWAKIIIIALVPVAAYFITMKYQ